MDEIKKLEIKALLLGGIKFTEEVELKDLGTKLKIRPLSSYEESIAELEMLNKIKDPAARTKILSEGIRRAKEEEEKKKTGKIETQKNIDDVVVPELNSFDALEAIVEFNVSLIYHGIKDFCDLEREDVKRLSKDDFKALLVVAAKINGRTPTSSDDVKSFPG